MYDIPTVKLHIFTGFLFKIVICGFLFPFRLENVQIFPAEYENEAQVGENFIDCSNGRPPDTRYKVCRFNLEDLGDGCVWQKDYGYDEGQPCVMFKLNRVCVLNKLLIIRKNLLSIFFPENCKN